MSRTRIAEWFRPFDVITELGEHGPIAEANAARDWTFMNLNIHCRQAERAQRLSSRQRRNEVSILGAFMKANDAHLFGMDIMRITGLRSGAMYPALWQLEEDGWLCSEFIPAEFEGLRRRAYSLAGLGDQ